MGKALLLPLRHGFGARRMGTLAASGREDGTRRCGLGLGWGPQRRVPFSAFSREGWQLPGRSPRRW